MPLPSEQHQNTTSEYTPCKTDTRRGMMKHMHGCLGKALPDRSLFNMSNYIIQQVLNFFFCFHPFASPNNGMTFLSELLAGINKINYYARVHRDRPVPPVLCLNVYQIIFWGDPISRTCLLSWYGQGRDLYSG